MLSGRCQWTNCLVRLKLNDLFIHHTTTQGLLQSHPPQLFRVPSLTSVQGALQRDHCRQPPARKCRSMKINKQPPKKQPYTSCSHHKPQMLNKSQGKMPLWPSEACVPLGCWGRTTKKPPATLRWGVNSTLIQLAMSLGEQQSNRLSKPAFPMHTHPQTCPGGESTIAPASPEVAQASALGLSSRALALASWMAAMQTCTSAAGLTFHSSAPSPSPAHQLHSSHAFLTFQLSPSFTSFPSCYSPSLPRQITAT